MRIAQVAPLYEAVPPKLYGGTERVVSYLTDALVDLGHDVTLFASGDSKTKAKLVASCDQALRLQGKEHGALVEHVLQLQMVIDRIESFDIVHYHTDCLHFPYSRNQPIAQLTTLHGRLDLSYLSRLYDVFYDIPVISISNAQCKPLPKANWLGTVYHGIPMNLYRPNFNPQSYLAFIGRISPEKRLDRAIEIAKRSGKQLKIAAKVDRLDQTYFDEEIVELLQSPHIEFLGEISDSEKEEFLGNASALLFPIDWPEPFGMVMIEAMACATPVIAYHQGSVPEIIDHGQNGYIVNSIAEAVDCVINLDQLDRKKVHHIFMQRFRAKQMAINYLEKYREAIKQATHTSANQVINSKDSPTLGENCYYGS